MIPETVNTPAHQENNSQVIGATAPTIRLGLMLEIPTLDTLKT
jgi:hypothetical protein